MTRKDIDDKYENARVTLDSLNEVEIKTLGQVIYCTTNTLRSNEKFNWPSMRIESDNYTKDDVLRYLDLINTFEEIDDTERYNKMSDFTIYGQIIHIHSNNIQINNFKK